MHASNRPGLQLGSHKHPFIARTVTKEQKLCELEIHQLRKQILQQTSP